MKISFRNKVSHAYTGYWRVLVKQGKIVEALFANEEGRAQALTDLMESQFGIPASQSVSCEERKFEHLKQQEYEQQRGGEGKEEEDKIFQILRSITSSIVFQAVDDDAGINFWLLSKEGIVHRRQNECHQEKTIATACLQSSIQNAFKQIGVRSVVRCEDRSLDVLRENRYKVDEKSDERKMLKLQSDEQSFQP